MKKILLVTFSIFTLVTGFSQNVRKTIANGNALNPFTWDCICIPLPGDSIIINHILTLDTDFGYSTGAVVVTATGKLIGDSPSRAVAVMGTALLENNGYYNVSRTALFGGRVSNHGVFMADSLFSNVTLNNGFVSTGSVYVETSFWNTGIFRLTDPTKEVVVRNYFLNGDSLISGVNAVFQMEGAMRVNYDFSNTDTILGGGQICIDGNSSNFGVITGTLDMCDLTGGNAVDFNVGVISPSVKVCQAPCTVSINEEETGLDISIYPNPSSSSYVSLSGIEGYNIQVFSTDGKLIRAFIGQANQIIDVTSWSAGIYFLHIQKDMTFKTARLVIQ